MPFPKKSLWLLALSSPIVFAQQNLVVCTEASPEGFDLVRYASSPAGDATQTTIFDQLVTFKPGTTEIIPALATEWEISDDGLTYTLNLRENVPFHTTEYFHPTRTFNADDVLWTFNRALDKEHPLHDSSPVGYPYFEAMDIKNSIQSIEKIDDYTIQFNLKTPDAAFLRNLAMGFASIYSKEYGEQLVADNKTDQLNTLPIGTGPFQFRRYVKDAQIRYQANPDYFRGKPEIDNLIYSINTDSSVRIQKLKNNECQISLYPPITDIPELKKDNNLQVKEIDALLTTYVSLNTLHPPLDNPKVRQAINLAIDTNAINKALYDGAATDAVNPYPPTMLGYNTSIEPWGYDPEKAKELLDKAGVKDTNITLYTRNGSSATIPNAALASQMIQADLAKVGINVTIRTFEFGELLQRVKNGEHDISLYGGWAGDNGDPDNFLSPNLTCAAAANGQNQAFWCNEKFDQYVQKAKQTTDENERIKYYKKAQEIFHEGSPWVTLAHPIKYSVTSSNIEGYTESPLSINDFSKVKVK